MILSEDGTRILVRHCSDADWGKNCGDIRYMYNGKEEEKIQGCLTTCDYDGCNAAPSLCSHTAHFVCALLLTLWLIFR